MKKTVVALFDTPARAHRAVIALRKVTHSEDTITAVCQRNQIEGASEEDAVDEKEPIGSGTGAVVGGLTGLLVGIGALPIPGVGPLLAAAPLAAAVTAGLGAASGALAAPLLDDAVGNDREGDVLRDESRTVVVIECAMTNKEEVLKVLEASGAISVDEDARAWSMAGAATAPATPADEPQAKLDRPPVDEMGEALEIPLPVEAELPIVQSSHLPISPLPISLRDTAALSGLSTSD